MLGDGIKCSDPVLESVGVVCNKMHHFPLGLVVWQGVENGEPLALIRFGYATVKTVLADVRAYSDLLDVVDVQRLVRAGLVPRNLASFRLQNQDQLLETALLGDLADVGAFNKLKGDDGTGSGTGGRI